MQELEKLLAPLSGDQPAGQNLRRSLTDATLTTMRARQQELRRADQPSRADWRALALECEEALRERTKDVELAFYLTFAWATLEGIAGVRSGLALITGLCEQLWDHVHPGVQGTSIDLEARTRVLSALGGPDFLRAVCQCALLAPPTRETPLTWEHFTSAPRVDQHMRAPNRKAKYDELVAAGWISSEQWKEHIAAAGLDTLRSAIEQLRQGEASTAQLQQLIEKRFESVKKEERPSIAPLATLLTSIREQLERHLPKVKKMETSEEAPIVEEPLTELEAPLPTSFGPIRTREDALRQLALIGDYFRTHEPNSPLAAICARAVRWGRMSFAELLLEVVEDKTALAKIWTAVGSPQEPHRS